MWFFKSLRNQDNCIVFPWKFQPVPQESARLNVTGYLPWKLGQLFQFYCDFFSFNFYWFCCIWILSWIVDCFWCRRCRIWLHRCHHIVINYNVLGFWLNRCHCTIIFNYDAVVFCLNRCLYTIIFISDVAGFFLDSWHYINLCISDFQHILVFLQGDFFWILSLNSSVITFKEGMILITCASFLRILNNLMISNSFLILFQHSFLSCVPHNELIFTFQLSVSSRVCVFVFFWMVASMFLHLYQFLSFLQSDLVVTL